MAIPIRQRAMYGQWVSSSTRCFTEKHLTKQQVLKNSSQKLTKSKLNFHPKLTLQAFKIFWRKCWSTNQTTEFLGMISLNLTYLAKRKPKKTSIAAWAWPKKWQAISWKCPAKWIRYISKIKNASNKSRLPISSNSNKFQ